MKFFNDALKLLTVLGIVLWLASHYQSNIQTVKSVGRAVVAKCKKPVQYKQLFIINEHKELT